VVGGMSAIDAAEIELEGNERETYAAVEAQHTVGFEDVHEGAEHALGAIWSACL